MKISQDKTSWRASGILRRDARHDKGFEEKTSGNRMKIKGNTKKWCRGQVGVRHEYGFNRQGRKSWHRYICTKCDKTFSDVPLKERAKFSVVAAEEYRLFMLYCQKGHLYDWVVKEYPTWFGYTHTSGYICVMCGHDSGKRRWGRNYL